MNATQLSALSDDAAFRLGISIASLMQAKRDAEHRDRWQTAWGTQTSLGLGRAVLRLVLQEAERDRPVPTDRVYLVAQGGAFFNDGGALAYAAGLLGGGFEWDNATTVSVTAIEGPGDQAFIDRVCAVLGCTVQA